MTTEKMLKRLQYSRNGYTSTVAKRILLNKSTIDKELQGADRFMHFVLKGDYENAILRADYYNRLILTE